ncbi:hypothetical protein [Hymenobacter antarcticus]|uniref:hypothetical protein n=1 Tax=Hymenobacter antarcticus TaxID=486270 RepID=UPI0031E83620
MDVSLQFPEAAHCVTGSVYLLTLASRSGPQRPTAAGRQLNQRKQPLTLHVFS